MMSIPKQTAAERRRAADIEARRIQLSNWESQKHARILEFLARATRLEVDAAVTMDDDGHVMFRWDIPGAFTSDTCAINQLEDWMLDSLESTLTDIDQQRNAAKNREKLAIEILSRLTLEEIEALKEAFQEGEN